MDYQQILPNQNLRKYIKCFWVLKQTEKSIETETETILPDGTFEIVFNLADRFRRFYADGKTEVQPHTILVGQMRQFVQIEPLGNINLFGIRFQSIGAYHFFKFPLHEITDQIQALDLVLEKSDQDLETQINESFTTNERISIIESFLTRKLADNLQTDKPMESAVENILQNYGKVSVSKIAKEFGISQRQLERNFRQKIGVSPKFFCRIIRLQNVLNAMQKAEIKDFPQIEVSFSYYDQAHFIHEFREFAGKSPTAFFTQQNQISEFFRS